MSATSTSPCLAATAPVNAPFSCPNNSLARSSSVRVAQFMERNGLSFLLLVEWMILAIRFFPTPLSPVSSTLQSDSLIFSTRLKIFFMPSLSAIIENVLFTPKMVFRAMFSFFRIFCSWIFFTFRMISSRSKGLVI